MKFKLIVASLTATLMSIAAHSAAATQSTQPTASPATVVKVSLTEPAPGSTTNDAISTRAAVAARLDTDPTLNGSVGDVPTKASAK